MPRSKVRKHHHQTHPSKGGVDRAGKNRSSVPVAIVFCVMVGIGIAYFAAGPSPLWLIVGAIAGVAVGYYFGKQLDRSFSKK